MEKLKELLRTLTQTVTVSGFERRNADKIKETALKYTDGFFNKAYVAKNGSVILAKEGLKKTGETKGVSDKKRRKIVLDAHIDTIGFVVSEILDNGYLRLSPIGGVDASILPSQEVVIYGKEEIFAVFSSVPPHLSKNDKAPEIGQLYVDTGFCDSRRLSEIADVGTPATLKNKFTLLSQNKVASGGLDDKVCIATILEAVNLLKNEEIHNTDVYCCFSSGEERGGKGAFHIFDEIKPDACIVLDVNFAKERASKDGEYGVLSKGGMISVSSVTNPSLTKMCMDTAKKYGIPFQPVVEMTGTGTNADIIPRTGTGVATAVVSIPIKYMHSSAELCDLDDVKSTAKLLSCAVVEYDKKPCGIPVYHKGGGELDGE